MTISADKEVRDAYEMRLKAEMDYNSDMAWAEEQGLKRGLEQGSE